MGAIAPIRMNQRKLAYLIDDRSMYDQFEKIKASLRGSYAEHALWSNCSPNNGCCREDGRSRACKSLLLMLGANIFNIVEHPALNNRDPNTSDHGRNNLN